MHKNKGLSFAESTTLISRNIFAVALILHTAIFDSFLCETFARNFFFCKYFAIEGLSSVAILTNVVTVSTIERHSGKTNLWHIRQFNAIEWTRTIAMVESVARKVFGHHCHRQSDKKRVKWWKWLDEKPCSNKYVVICSLMSSSGRCYCRTHTIAILPFHSWHCSCCGWCRDIFFSTSVPFPFITLE